MPHEKHDKDDKRFALLRDAYLQAQIRAERELANMHQFILNQPRNGSGSDLLLELSVFRYRIKQIIREAFIRLKRIVAPHDILPYDLDTWISSSVNWTFKNGAYPCDICGETRATDKAHIIPRSRGGTDQGNVLYLCPTHHKLFDRHQLSRGEWEKLNFSDKAPATQEYARSVILPRLERYWSGNHKHQ